MTLQRGTWGGVGARQRLSPGPPDLSPVFLPLIDFQFWGHTWLSSDSVLGDHPWRARGAPERARDQARAGPAGEAVQKGVSIFNFIFVDFYATPQNIILDDAQREKWLSRPHCYFCAQESLQEGLGDQA